MVMDMDGGTQMAGDAVSGLDSAMTFLTTHGFASGFDEYDQSSVHSINN